MSAAEKLRALGPLNFKTGIGTTWQEDLIFYVGWFVILLVILTPLFGLVVLLDWLVIPD